ncbi:MAG: hypothetical protein OXF56_08595 [Rhodobacteraceae bacterium]|nr:hypothetical protein [Paracoccaceae bacterium]
MKRKRTRVLPLATGTRWVSARRFVDVTGRPAAREDGSMIGIGRRISRSEDGN